MKYLLLSLALLPVRAFAQDGNFFLDQEYTIDGDGTLDLICGDADVRITGSNRTTAHVVIRREVTTQGVVKGNRTFSVDVSEENGNLVIREKQTGHLSVSLGYVSEEYTIDIEVPQEVSLHLKVDDGPLTVQRLKGAITVQSDDGDVLLQDCTSEAFDLDVDDGDIEMNRGQGELVIRIDDGDVSVQEGNFSRVDVSADDGDIELTTRLTDQGTYRVEVSDGDIDVNITGGGGEFDIRHDDTQVDTSGPFNLVKSSDDYTQLTLPEGNATVELRVDDGRVALSTAN